MLLTGQFSRFHAKLRTHITSFERSREARKGHEY
jgi:hypothetical protein